VYCSSCGGNVLQQLTYCNHCGSKLNLAKREAEITHVHDVSPESLVWAILSVFIGGMGVIIGLMAVMKNVLHFNMTLIVVISLLCFLMMSVIETVFIWRFIGHRHSGEQGGPAKLGENTRQELGAVQAKALAEPRESVTDHTTRSFEPVYTKRTNE
jgi:hypothetical protein